MVQPRCTTHHGVSQQAADVSQTTISRAMHLRSDSRVGR
uniref:Uncharacterized protein n=1 Tax=Arundo donax TaxID=35708 RepID=A0A0A9C6W8_ARUDO